MEATGRRRRRLFTASLGRRCIAAVGLSAAMWGCGSDSTSPATGFAGSGVVS